jgi:hypothetical protein
MLFPDIEAEDLPDVSENSNDSWASSRKTQKAKTAGRKGDHCKKSRIETEDDKSSTRDDELGTCILHNTYM